jgi:CubicO group peptidase (beta-lactamase class C family)
LELNSLKTWCAEQVDLGRTPSLSIAAAVDGELAFAAAFGFADLERGRPATTETAYLLASITKPITATAVCRLADSGLLQLDDPVETMLGGLSFTRHRGERAPTLRHVLQHTSGLGAHFEFFYVDTDGPRRPFEETIERYGVLYAEPGTRYCYSNLGYGVLDEVIRQVSGRSPEQYVHDEVFAPLGMETASIGPDYVCGAEHAALRYSRQGDVLPVYDMCHRGASSAWMSASDLVHFGLSHAGGPTVLTPAMQKEMTASAVQLDAGRRYGLGWIIWTSNGRDFVTHSGGMPGVSTRLCVVPSEKLVVAVLTNQSATGPPPVADETIDRCLTTLLPDYVANPSSPEGRAATSGLEGVWAGSVVTHVGAVPLQVRLGPGGTASASLAGSRADALGAATHSFFPSADVVLEFPLQLPTPDARVRSPNLALNLFHTGERLEGAATACPDPNRADGRGGNAYGHWCELEGASSR